MNNAYTQRKDQDVFALHVPSVGKYTDGFRVQLIATLMKVSEIFTFQHRSFPSRHATAM